MQLYLRDSCAGIIDVFARQVPLIRTSVHTTNADTRLTDATTLSPICKLFLESLCGFWWWIFILFAHDDCSFYTFFTIFVCNFNVKEIKIFILNKFFDRILKLAFIYDNTLAFSSNLKMLPMVLRTLPMDAILYS